MAAVMNERDEQFALGSPSFYRRVWLAPVCLILIASVHFVRVMTIDQTQWKGGGFGMFSTVDARTARFVRAYLVTETGEIPVDIPDQMKKRETEFRAAPQKSQLDLLATELANFRWYSPEMRWRKIATQHANHSPDSVADRDILYPSKLLALTDRKQLLGERWKIAATRGRRAEKVDSAAIPVKAIRLEYWKYHYDKSNNQLVAEKQFDVVRNLTEEL
ncbi:MAG: hypothetical protein ACI9G1_003225 [Pirellulaceae bacterium]|jgi:hypothetical protein